MECYRREFIENRDNFIARKNCGISTDKFCDIHNAGSHNLQATARGNVVVVSRPHKPPFCQGLPGQDVLMHTLPQHL